MGNKLSLQALVRSLTEQAASAPSGRSADTVYGGHERALRQTVIALRADAGMAEHGSPGEATLQVLQGRVRLDAEETSWEARTGDLLIIPEERHSLTALEDSVVLLTVART
ncbi:cupin domain-containing protein [Spiractinospora alimapuensis]|uniref:cupin domain-containing protein n=1 Tax=Spiractinospora alimapuensis TaxID=2820884 RepID=UPI001F1E8C0E|nr:cupin domain-containing protein [Spiractinospora alimapuensis]QVQ52057.1 cupin domain-containing protein [Spiractinospora alimapuensis]